MIYVQDLLLNYGNFCAINHISFRISRENGIVGLLGPNGAGKTTTMRILTGYLKPTSGYIEIDSLPLNDDNIVEIKKRIGYLPEANPLYPEMLVSEYLDFIGAIRGLDLHKLKNSKESLVERLELGSHYYTPLSYLSKGFRQRVALAATLIHDPEIIILDEPTTGLDPNQIISIREFIKKLGGNKTLILSTHILKEVEDVCDRVIIINKGKIVVNKMVSELQKSNYIVLIAFSDKDSIEETLKMLPIVKNVSIERMPNSNYKKYICELTEDSPEKLFNEIKKTDWQIREFSTLERSLEEVFRELTQN